ncbi:MAG: putative metal-binding protein [Desulforhopalus sp.]|jgi:uncharacterized metal-binding protein
MIIVPCCGTCNFGRLSVEAGRIVASQENGKVFSLGAVAARIESLENVRDILVINGCGNACVSKVLDFLMVPEKWNLDVSTLGIAKDADGKVCGDDLTLVVDAIEAACNDVGDQIPNASGTCGCC